MAQQDIVNIDKVTINEAKAEFNSSFMKLSGSGTNNTPFYIGVSGPGLSGEVAVTNSPWQTLKDKIRFDSINSRGNWERTGLLPSMARFQNGTYTARAHLWSMTGEVVATKTFTISGALVPETPASIKILNPLGGETFRIGQTVPIRWEASKCT